MIGKTLLHYEVTARIGAGGMGEVYRATDTKLGREVAIKVLPAEVAKSEERLARFRREARVLAALNHPGIASIYGLEEAGGQPFLVMELAPGEDLKQRLERGPIPVDEATLIAEELVEALKAAHDRGIVHRDLKPANIKLGPEGEVKILDFGLARAWGGADGEDAASDLSSSPTEAFTGTSAGVILGTAAYMSPEQASGKAVDKRSDIWSFGVVLFEMLTGERLFGGETASEVLASVIKDDLPLDAPALAASSGLRRLLRWCLTRSVRQRLQDIGDVRILLAELASGDAPAPGATTSRAPWGAVALASLAAFVSGSAVAWWLGGELPGASRPDAIAGGWEARPLTATGDAWNASLAPDGRTVAYLTGEGLVTQDLQGGEPNLILEDALWSAGGGRGSTRSEPQWAIDSSGVVFSDAVDATSLGVFRVPRMGGEPVPRVVATLRGGQLMASARPVEEGAFLLVRALENRDATPWLRLVSRTAETAVEVPPDIENLWDAAPSPDGRWIAYIGERADRTTVLGTLSVVEGEARILVSEGFELSKWSEFSTNRQFGYHRILSWPSASRIYYRRHSSRGTDVQSIGVDPVSGAAVGVPRRVYGGLPPGASFDVSSDEATLVYSGGVVRTQAHLYRFDLSRGGAPVEHRVLTRGTARHLAPSFSPDGEHVALIRRMGGSEDVLVVPTAGGDARLLKPLFEWDQLSDLDWSPDGESLAVYGLTSEGSVTAVVPRAGGRVRVLELRPISSGWLDWSPDGRFVAYPTDNDSVFVIHELDGGAERDYLRELAGEKIQAIFSPDGSELLVKVIGGEEAGFWQVSAESGDARRLVTYGTRTEPVHWEDGVIYSLSPEGVLLAFDLEAEESREVGRVPGAPLWEGGASIRIESGRLELVCAIDDPRESDVWVLHRDAAGLPEASTR